MFRHCIIVLLLIVCGNNAQAGAGAWQAANTFYKSKQYDSAVFYYEQLATTRPQDAVLYYDLGNAYYRLNKIGPAVLNYQKALYLDPGYKEAQDNLTLTESRISNRIPSASDIFFVAWWNRATSAQNNVAWALVSVFIFLGIVVLSALRRLGKTKALPNPQLTGALIVVLAGCLVLAFVSAANKANSGIGVVMQNDTPLMNEQHTGKAQNLVPEGTTVTVLGTRTGWTQVRLPDGRTGWMREEHVNKI